MLDRSLAAIVLAAATLALALTRTNPSSSAEARSGAWPPTTPVAHPSEWVVIEQGQPYVVPAGAVFVVTAVGTPQQDFSNAIASLFANGTLLVSTTTGMFGTAPCSTPALDVPLAVSGGTTLSVSVSVGIFPGQAWGFLLRPGAPQAASFQPPPPWEWIVIEEGQPYRVPAGKLFVPTAIHYSWNGAAGAMSLHVDGEPRVTANMSADWDTSVRALPAGLAVPAGSLVEPVDPAGLPPLLGKAWGFLVDAR